jgi:hypothetical protein
VKKKTCTDSLLRAFRSSFVISLLVTLSGPLLHAQEIHIRVLNARNGKPITNECLNLWLGPLHGQGLLAPTNNEGVVVLHLGDNQVTADAVSARACGGNASVGPKPFPKDSDGISVAGDYYIVCQEYGKFAPGEPPTSNSLKQMVPSYPIKKILESGVAAGNTCGKVRAEAKPGELVIFERPTTFGERLRQ